MLTWVFVIGTGRSGSTTILEMLNQLPNTTLCGENFGMANGIAALASSLAELDKQKHPSLPFRHGPIDRKKSFHLLHQYVWTAAGIHANHGRVGFKTIRVRDPETLDAFKRVFPHAKYILNIRHPATQVHSGFQKYKHN